MLGKFPVYSFANELGINQKEEKRITSWNENLGAELSKIDKIDFHFISSTRAIKKTTTIIRNGLKITFIATPPKANTLTFYRYLIWRSNKIITEEKPDIVHGIGTEHIWGYIASKYKNNIITIHGVMQEIIKKNSPSFFSFRSYFAHLEKKILKKSRNLIVINPYVKENLLLNTKSKLFFVENAISPIFRKEKAEPAKSSTILFIGDFVPLKNVLDLLKALSKTYSCGVKQFTLHIVGNIVDTKYKRKIDEYLKERSYLKERINISEFLLPNELADEISESAFLVLCSNQETAPMVIAESMSMGLPVIATNVGGIKYMIKDKSNGFIVEPGNIEQLSNSIVQLIQNPQLRKVMGQKAREDAFNRYDPQKIALKTYDVYKEILGEKNG